MTDTTGGLGRAALADGLGFQLYATSRAIMGVYRKMLTEHGLTYPQYLMMLAVWEADGQTVSELCRALDLDSGTVSPLIARLEADGFIVKQRSGSDGRSIRVNCTDRGRMLRDQVGLIPDAVVAATGLSDLQFHELSAQLDSLRLAVRAAWPASEAIR